MRFLSNFAHFWYDFIVGDDWMVAVGVVVALVLTALLVGYGVAAWWVMPVAVTLLLFGSLWRATTSA
jgi:hypothetical protein